MAELWPEKPGQSAESRAKDLDNAMSWERNRGVDVAALEDPDFDSDVPFETLEMIPIVDKRTPREKAKDVEDVLAWKRKPKAYKGPNKEAYERVDELLPEKPGQTEKERAND